jgi:hypothetical protein
LPSRADDLDEAITVHGPHGIEEWSASHDEWYADLMPDGLGIILREGAWWEGDGACWTLAPRDVYVLAGKPESGPHGYLTTTRLLLNEDHVVLCSKEQEVNVRKALTDAGCPAPDSLEEQAGSPEGWVLFKDIRPTVAVPHDPADGIINILRPVHDIEIELLGGIRVEHAKWLHGHPPQIQLRGDCGDLDVTIDQQTASREANNSYTAPGWDSLGLHRAFSGGVITSYEIVTPPETWAHFPAITYNATGRPSAIVAICGPIVDVAGEHAVLLTRTDPVWLLGAMPGQITMATPSADVRTPAFLARADFPIVWVLPLAPLLANKETAIIELIQRESPGTVRVVPKARAMLKHWAYAVINASYKHLRIEPESDEAKQLWAEYILTAKRLRKECR